MWERTPLDGLTVRCDDCSTGFQDTGLDDFNVAIVGIKDLGWRISKVKGEWRHTCPDCAADEFEPYDA